MSVSVVIVSDPREEPRAVDRGTTGLDLFGDDRSVVAMRVNGTTVDLAAEPELELYDMAALVPIVVQAGGRFTSLAGEAGPWGGDAVATNGLLHDVVLERLAAETD